MCSTKYIPVCYTGIRCSDAKNHRSSTRKPPPKSAFDTGPLALYNTFKGRPCGSFTMAQSLGEGGQGGYPKGILCPQLSLVLNFYS
jgi:hypothetical protein